MTLSSLRIPILKIPAADPSVSAQTGPRGHRGPLGREVAEQADVMPEIKRGHLKSWEMRRKNAGCFGVYAGLLRKGAGHAAAPPLCKKELENSGAA